MKHLPLVFGFSLIALCSLVEAAPIQKIEVRRGENVERIQLEKNQFTYRNQYLTRHIPLQACNEAEVRKFLVKFDQISAKEPVSIKGLAPANSITVTKNGRARKIPPGSRYGRWLSSLDAQVLQLAVAAAVDCQEKR